MLINCYFYFFKCFDVIDVHVVMVLYNVISTYDALCLQKFQL